MIFIISSGSSMVYSAHACVLNDLNVGTITLQYRLKCVALDLARNLRRVIVHCQTIGFETTSHKYYPTLLLPPASQTSRYLCLNHPRILYQLCCPKYAYLGCITSGLSS